MCRKLNLNLLIIHLCLPIYLYVKFYYGLKWDWIFKIAIELSKDNICYLTSILVDAVKKDPREKAPTGT